MGLAVISHTRIFNFLQEADEQLQLLDEGIIKLEQEEDSAHLLQEISCAAYTLKSSSATIGHKRIY